MAITCESAADRVKDEHKENIKVTKNFLTRCQDDLKEEKIDGTKKLKDSDKECEKDKKEITRVKKKENDKCEELGKELGTLL